VCGPYFVEFCVLFFSGERSSCEPERIRDVWFNLVQSPFIQEAWLLIFQALSGRHTLLNGVFHVRKKTHGKKKNLLIRWCTRAHKPRPLPPPQPPSLIRSTDCCFCVLLACHLARSTARPRLRGARRPRRLTSTLQQVFFALPPPPSRSSCPSYQHTHTHASMKILKQKNNRHGGRRCGCKLLHQRQPGSVPAGPGQGLQQQRRRR